MYTKSQYDAWVIEVANYFMKHFEYQMVSMTQDSSQVWLVNQNVEDNAIIMVTSTSLSNIDRAMISKHRESLAVVFKTKAEGLNISVNQEDKVGDDMNVVVGPNFISSSQLLTSYGDLSGLLKVSQNPDRSLSKAVLNLKKTIGRMQKQARYRSFPVTNVISIICVVVFLLAQYLILIPELNINTVAVMLGAFYKPFIVHAHEWFRFITAGFLHISFLHLIMNLMALRNLGVVMETVMEGKKYLFTLIAGILMGNAFVFILDEGVIGLGISGGLFALLGAMCVYLFETKAMRNPKVMSQVFQVLFINLIISSLPGVSATAHLGGLIAGLLCGLVFSKRKDWDYLRKGTMILSAVFVVGIGIVMTQHAGTLSSPRLDMSVINSWYELGFKNYANRLSGFMK
ncbi:rhomboid family intramembrane serine protease [Erysipelothrix rhusiopathiae]|uniref:rhomboid family intramembrane serine protease n=1 Tax=Erysipelothrix rhusiopathiae TaxID=1648 RepID=UPI001EE050D4|nr:rhomboid family intramembrane serine protease [Erysipelothrix rhusiopathiae]MCG4436298.1 rhomboid family intramembrane serine protease [Erysipelothrix rhusiopathiae]MCG4456213.1 rhomboid family intramembrane serine protease [Erysipelothrix rhusiopathiae]MDE8032435.1 rhomboid family intramembrane serine protease [Erysipelothrix rhusiopathiae]MDE8036268.1 rhomboid family intramembrane serine protease [Erysipelothrix rhusiopathiae]MDE8037742.1 rhomboid family intramembrane serine protease [Ery